MFRLHRVKNCRNNMQTTISPAEIHRRSDRRAEMDDDLPNVPEISPLDSAQCRRWAREEHRNELHTLQVYDAVGRIERTP